VTEIIEKFRITLADTPKPPYQDDTMPIRFDTIRHNYLGTYPYLVSGQYDAPSRGKRIVLPITIGIYKGDELSLGKMKPEMSVPNRAASVGVM
jgi:hypothetical protein